MWLGKGLLTNGGDSWHRQRKLLTPSFHFKILSTFKEPMEECCATMVAKLRPLADGERIVDVYPFVSLMALDVICGECGCWCLFRIVICVIYRDGDGN